MTVELEEITAWRIRVNSRLSTLGTRAGDGGVVTDELKDRVSKLEATVGREAWARAKMDEDLSDLKIQFISQERLLKALSSTQSEHTATLREHGEMLRKLRTGQTELRRDVTEIRQDVTKIHVGIRTIIDLIDKRDVGEAAGPGLPEGGQGRD